MDGMGFFPETNASCVDQMLPQPERASARKTASKVAGMTAAAEGGELLFAEVLSRLAGGGLVIGWPGVVRILEKK